MSTDVKRVLIVAENASVRFGGEAILPYHYFRLLRARGVDAHLIVHERCREELATLFPAAADRLHFVRDLALQKVLHRLGRGLPRRIDDSTLGMANQFMTQLRQRRIVRSLKRPNCVVHQPIPVSPRTPSMLFGLGAPVVIGPLNGGMEYPPAFRKWESPISRLVVRFGRASGGFLNTILPGKLQAAVVLVANERTRAALPHGVRGQISLLPENAVNTGQWTTSNKPQQPEPSRFCFIGRLVDWKALDIAIEAIAQTPDAHLDVIGDGPMLATWQAASLRLGVGRRVQFHGWLSQQQCARKLESCAALVLPSLLECGGAVVLEAMGMGKPVIATDWGGPADYLDASCGILVKPESRRALIDGFAAAMRKLSACSPCAQRMGAAGRKKLLKEFNWQKKLDTMLEIYASALSP